jgi:hypothetical protein
VNRMQLWLERDKLTQKAVQEQRRDHKAELNSRLRLLGSRKHCPKHAIGWLTTEHREDRRKAVVLSSKANATSGNHPAIALSGLEQLRDGALLTLSVLTDSKAKLLEYSIGVQGMGKILGAPWYARIDLTEEPEGEGPCGHPLLHCHVGLDPSTQGEPETRVPLPFLAPAEALDWLLATVDHRLEPSEAEP